MMCHFASIMSGLSGVSSNIMEETRVKRFSERERERERELV